jgi:hypothetical protein
MVRDLRPERRPGGAEPATGGLWIRVAGYGTRRPVDKSRPAHGMRTGVRPRDGRGQASSSAATLRVLFGSTWTPGPIVVENVTFRR